MPPPPPPPPDLDDDAISEILLRLPPDEPQWLFRAALVCKPWLRTISDPAFLRRYRDFHGAPPLLGLVDADGKINRGHSFRLIPTTAMPAFPLPSPDARCGDPLDCRHGLVLVSTSYNYRVSYRSCSLFVCDPITGGRYPLPQPKIKFAWLACSTAVFCAATACKHLDCHGGPFYVVLMAKDNTTGTLAATIYSSEIGAWNTPATLEGDKHHVYDRGTLIGDEIYFKLVGRTGIIKYEWKKNCLSLVNLPPSWYHVCFTLMVTEDCSLGLAAIEHSNLYLWSRRLSSEGSTEWVQCRVIDLEKLVPMANPSAGTAFVNGFAEGVGAIIFNTAGGLFMIELKSGCVKKIDRWPVQRVLPYMSFYTPGMIVS